MPRPGVASRLFAMPTSSPRPADPPRRSRRPYGRNADFLGRTDADNLLHLEEASDASRPKIKFRGERHGPPRQDGRRNALAQCRSTRARCSGPPSTPSSTGSLPWATNSRSRARRWTAGIRGETAQLEADIFAALLEHGEVEHRATLRWRSMPGKFGRPVGLDNHRLDSEFWSLVVRDRTTLVAGWWL